MNAKTSTSARRSSTSVFSTALPILALSLALDAPARTIAIPGENVGGEAYGPMMADSSEGQRGGNGDFVLLFQLPDGPDDWTDIERCTGTLASGELGHTANGTFDCGGYEARVGMRTGYRLGDPPTSFIGVRVETSDTALLRPASPLNDIRISHVGIMTPIPGATQLDQACRQHAEQNLAAPGEVFDGLDITLAEAVNITFSPAGLYNFQCTFNVLDPDTGDASVGHIYSGTARCQPAGCPGGFSRQTVEGRGVNLSCLANEYDEFTARELFDGDIECTTARGYIGSSSVGDFPDRGGDTLPPGRILIFRN